MRSSARPMLAKLGLALASVALTLLVFEAAIRLKVLPEPAFVVSEGWWMERWLRTGRGSNPREFVHIDPDLGWIPTANLDALEYNGVRISTNSAHMRGRREIPLSRTDAARIVAVGDSYTFGQCAEDDESFPAVLERELPNAEVLNLGVMSYGQDQALLRMRRDGLPFQPDYVVFGFHRSDVRRNTLRFREFAKPRFRITDTGLRLENQPVPDPSHFRGRLWPPRMWNYALMWRDGRRYGTPEWRQHMRALSRAIVHRMAEEARAGGARLLVVYLPSAGDLRGEAPFGWGWMAELCAEGERAGFDCADPVPRFRELLPTEDDVREHFRCHYSAALYQAVGEVVAERLVELDPERFGEPGPRP
jgi:hypothetical protein